MPGYRKRIRKMINENFGKNPLDGYNYYNGRQRLDNIRRMHKILDSEVDEITWKDLEMDEVFLRINHTNSFIGEQMLYHKLHGYNDINEEMISHLEKDQEIRQAIEEKLIGIGKLMKDIIYMNF